jgi:hypothetical protein
MSCKESILNDAFKRTLLLSRSFTWCTLCSSLAQPRDGISTHNAHANGHGQPLLQHVHEGGGGSCGEGVVGQPEKPG